MGKHSNQLGTTTKWRGNSNRRFHSIKWDPGLHSSQQTRQHTICWTSSAVSTRLLHPPRVPEGNQDPRRTRQQTVPQEPAARSPQGWTTAQVRCPWNLASPSEATSQKDNSNSTLWRRNTSIPRSRSSACVLPRGYSFKWGGVGNPDLAHFRDHHSHWGQILP
jgi:hypothetical protein